MLFAICPGLSPLLFSRLLNVLNCMKKGGVLHNMSDESQAAQFCCWLREESDASAAVGDIKGPFQQFIPAERSPKAPCFQEMKSTLSFKLSELFAFEQFIKLSANEAWVPCTCTSELLLLRLIIRRKRSRIKAQQCRRRAGK